jgi:hypothetical protein
MGACLGSGGDDDDADVVMDNEITSTSPHSNSLHLDTLGVIDKLADPHSEEVHFISADSSDVPEIARAVAVGALGPRGVIDINERRMDVSLAIDRVAAELAFYKTHAPNLCAVGVVMGGVLVGVLGVHSFIDGRHVCRVSLDVALDAHEEDQLCAAFSRASSKGGRGDVDRVAGCTNANVQATNADVMLAHAFVKSICRSQAN